MYTKTLDKYIETESLETIHFTTVNLQTIQHLVVLWSRQSWSKVATVVQTDNHPISVSVLVLGIISRHDHAFHDNSFTGGFATSRDSFVSAHGLHGAVRVH